jgi:hypothetical protein
MTIKTGNGGEDDELDKSYHDKNLIMTINTSSDKAWITTKGTFWMGSLCELMEFLQSNAIPCKQKADCGCDNTSE